jgi:hypothetical protein
MENIDMFERASRNKTRFAYKGMISVEDLWDLSVQTLDRIFQGLNAKLRLTREESLLGPKATEDSELELQVNIVRRIVEVKLEEIAERKSLAERAAKRQKILSVLAEKQDAGLMSKSEEDLKKMLEEL